MGKLQALLISCGLIAAFAAQADRVWSRSIMASCAYVYDVESDVIMEAPPELLQIYSGAPLYVRAKLTNSWNNEPRESDTFIAVANEKGRATLTFESMSVSGNFLFRDMRFDWVVKNTNGEWMSVSPPSFSDVGRRFGEACSTERYSDSQFVEREVKL